jgi:hypothetical protein
MVASLPEPARRWLLHAIQPGTPLAGTTVLQMRGQIRLGSWRPFTAEQVVSPAHGYIWAAVTRMFGAPVTGYDRMSDGTTEMRWRLFDRLTVVSSHGENLARSAAGRLANEFVIAPTSFRGATWRSGAGCDTAISTWTVDGRTHDVELQVAPDGRLESAVIQRWGNPDRKGFRLHPFGVSVDQEATFDGVTIPARLRAAWWWGTEREDEGEFFRAEITRAQFV